MKIVDLQIRIHQNLPGFALCHLNQTDVRMGSEMYFMDRASIRLAWGARLFVVSLLLSHCPHHESIYMLGPSWCPGSSARTCWAHLCPFRAHVNKQPTLHALESHCQRRRFQFHWLFNPAPSIIYSSLAIHQIFILPMNFPAWTCHYEDRGKGWGVTAPGNSALLQYWQLPPLLLLASWLFNPVISCPSPP